MNVQVSGLGMFNHNLFFRLQLVQVDTRARKNAKRKSARLNSGSFVLGPRLIHEQWEPQGRHLVKGIEGKLSALKPPNPKP